LEKPLVLVVDDDPAIRRYLKAGLERAGFRSSLAADGREAIEKTEAEAPSLIILDMKMPQVDGVEVIRRLREWSIIPIIMLSGYATNSDQVRCLNLGADDFMAKPFQLDEMIARIRAVLRRAALGKAAPEQPDFRAGSLEINFARRRVAVDGREVKLTPTEYTLLCELALNANKVLTHGMLLKRVWGPEYGQEREYLRTFIAHLRKSLGDGRGGPRRLVTVPGVGYQIKTG
jgi:two-component system KDP operon response regulator KdpE